MEGQGLLRDVCGAGHPEALIEFEKAVRLRNVCFIDAFIPSTGVLQIKPIESARGTSPMTAQQSAGWHGANAWMMGTYFQPHHRDGAFYLAD